MSELISDLESNPLTAKPRSPRQKEAARRNGSRSPGSPGVRSTARSVADSSAYGLLARSVLLAGESRRRFDAFVSSLEAELQPETPIERLLVYKMVVAHWRHMRSWQHERALISAGTPKGSTGDPATLDAVALTDPDRRVPVLSHFEARYDRQFSRSLDRFLHYRAQRIRTATQSEKNISDQENS